MYILKRNNNVYDVILYIFAILFLFLFKPSRLSSFDAYLNFSYSVVFFILVFFFLVRHSRFTDNWLRFDFVFLLGFSIVHIQIPFLASIGVEPDRPELIWFNKEVVNFATWFSVVALVLWMLGYSSYRVGKNKFCFQFREHDFHVNYLVFDVSLLIALIAFFSTIGSAFYSGIYDGSASWGAGAAYMYLICQTLLHLRVVYFFKGLPKRAGLNTVFRKLVRNKIFFFVAVVYIVAFFSIGSRTQLLKILMFAAGSYAIFVKPISLNKMIVYVVIAAFLFALLAMGRGRDAESFENENIIERGYHSFVQSDSFNLTGELASSNRILYMALDIVPENHDYLYGLTYFVGISGAVPLLAGRLVKILEIPPMYRSTSNFFTVITLGDNPSWGQGSEIIADIYVNFGVYGVFLIMLFFGRFCAWSYFNSLSGSLKTVIVYLCLLSDALMINRGMLLYPLSPIVYMLVVHYLFAKSGSGKVVIKSVREIR